MRIEPSHGTGAPASNLFVLPIETFNEISDNLPVADIVSFGRVNHALHHCLTHPAMRHGPLLQRMAETVRDNAADDRITATLTAIAALSLPQRPGTLRTYAVALVAPMRQQRDAVAAMWQKLIDDTRLAIVGDVLSNRQPEAIDKAMTDLDVACMYDEDQLGWDAVTRCDFKERLQTVSVENLPRLLDVAAARFKDFKWEEIESLIGARQVHLSGVSNRVALALTVPSSGRLSETALEARMTRFGITVPQRDALVFPAFAEKFSGPGNARVTLAEFLYTDLIKDPQLTACIDNAFLRDRYALFQSPLSTWMSMVAWNGPGDTARTVQWTAKAHAFVRWVEADAYASSAIDPKGAAHPDADREYDPIATYCQLTSTMQNHQVEFDGLGLALAAPLRFQPMLVDRWADLLNNRIIAQSGEALLQRVSRWRASAVPFFLEKGEVINAVRAYVAELRAYIKAAPFGVGNRRVQETVAVVFDTLPVESWGALLALMQPRAPGARALIDNATLGEKTKQFLSSPRSTLRFTTPMFARYLVSVAAMDFMALPDRATDYKAKYGVFCDRFAIKQTERIALRDALFKAISDQMPVSHSGARAAVKALLSGFGFGASEFSEAFLGVMLYYRQRES